MENVFAECHLAFREVLAVMAERGQAGTFSCSSCFFSAASMDCAVISVTSIHLHLLCL